MTQGIVDPLTQIDTPVDTPVDAPAQSLENSTVKPPDKRRRLFIILLIVFGFLLISTTAVFLFYKLNPSSPFSLKRSRSQQDIPEPSSSLTQLEALQKIVEPKPIPHGKIGFSVGQADKSKSQFSRGYIDPYDPAENEKQTITITVKNSAPITNVSAILKTDNKTSNPINLLLINGTNTDGQWQGSWTVQDTYLYIYNLIFIANSSNGESSVEITLR